MARKLVTKNSPPRQGLQLLKKPAQSQQKKVVSGKPPVKLSTVTQPGPNGSGSNSKIPRAATTAVTKPGHDGISPNDSGPEEGVRDSVGDISFQNCMHQRKAHEEVSNVESY